MDSDTRSARDPSTLSPSLGSCTWGSHHAPYERRGQRATTPCVNSAAIHLRGGGYHSPRASLTLFFLCQYLTGLFYYFKRRPGETTNAHTLTRCASRVSRCWANVQRSLVRRCTRGKPRRRRKQFVGTKTTLSQAWSGNCIRGPQCAFEMSMFMCPAVHKLTRN